MSEFFKVIEVLYCILPTNWKRNSSCVPHGRLVAFYRYQENEYVLCGVKQSIFVRVKLICMQLNWAD